MSNMTVLDAITKKFFVQDGVINQVHEKAYLFNELAVKREKEVMGKDYTYAIRTGRNRYAARPIAEAGDFGTFGAQEVKNVVVPNSRHVTGIELSADVVNAATGANKGAFISAFTLQTKYGMEDTMRGVNRQLHGDGTDALCYWTGADDTSGTNVDDGQGNGFPIHLEPGATVVDVIDASDHATSLGTITLTKGAETATNLAVTWTGTVSGTAAGDYAVLSGSLGKALTGLAAVVSASNPVLLSGGLHGITVASTESWKAQVFGNNGTKRALTNDLMQQVLTEIGLRSAASAEDIDVMIGNGRIKDKLVKLMLADQVQISPTKLKGGYSSFDYNGIKFVVDPQCKRNRIYFLNFDSMDFLTATGGVTWASYKDGSIWKQKIGTAGYADAYQAVIRLEGALACKQRNANAVLTDLTD